MMPQQYGYGYGYGQPMQFSNANGYPAQYPVTTPPVQARPANTAEHQQMVQMQRELTTLKLERIESDVNHILNDLQTKIVIDRPRDFATLCRLSKQDQQAEIAHWTATRRQVEQQLPNIGLPMSAHMQLQGAQTGPVRLDYDSAPQIVADPTLAAGNKPLSEYDRMVMEIREKGTAGLLAAHARHTMGAASQGVTQLSRNTPGQ